MSMFDKYSIEELQFMCDNSSTLIEFGKKLGYKSESSQCVGAKKAIEKYSLKTDFISSENIKNGKSPTYGKIDYSKFCIGGHTRNNTLRNNLISIRGEKCELCGINSWQEKPLQLQVHHINGIRTDNRLENLQLLCPNCHSQTENFAGKNKYKEKVSDEDIIKAIESSYSIREASIKLGLSDTVSGNYKRFYRIMNTYKINLKQKEKHVCCDCGREIEKKATRCFECNLKLRNANMPSREELENDIITISSFVAIGEKYGVTDNAVRKWCKKYGLPYKKSDIAALA